ncbi:ABC transporter ATP-binding protein [Desulfocurvibacter africanus]|uniref:ABC transporter ATP-binding protein n=1 Tax=Desulfocurvibacter africanus TaxID=873 RepID=UPI0004126D16|nr:ABC transporter ATP-binding protein [Desulfocurvibacter africanus]
MHEMPDVAHALDAPDSLTLLGGPALPCPLGRMDGPDFIDVRDVRKIFNQGRPDAFEALKGLRLSLARGKATAFKGPSGSGKTTLLSLIGCMARPTSGRILLDGSEITSLPERFMAQVRRGTFGFMFQGFNLIRGLSLLENILLPTYPRAEGHKTARLRAEALLERFGMTAKAGQRVELLSGGEKQRAALARALVNTPRVLIADEPTAHLDTALAEELLGFLARLKAEGLTLLLASHDPLVLGSGLVDRVIELRDGRIVGQD